MRAINHALTGAIIGLTVAEPVIALPAAIASHLVCDAIPHHGSQTNNPGALRSLAFRLSLLVDAGLCAGLVLLLGISRPSNWPLAALCAFLAAAPDFLWVKRYLRASVKKAWQPSTYSRLALRLQWFQRPIGAAVELVWFLAALALLLPFLAG